MNPPTKTGNGMKRYFRSIADLENRPEFQEFLQREFPQAASEFPEGVSRRRWLQLMGASLSFGAASGCRYYKEEFAAFTAAPEGRIPGVPTYFATNFEWAGRIVHALVTSLDGRPIQLRGNPDHPSLDVSAASEFQDGKEKQFKQVGLDAISQASILSLYDPDRLGEAFAQSADVAAGSKAFLSGDEAASSAYNAMAAIVRNSGSKMDPEGLQELIAKSSQEIAASLGAGTAVIFESTSSPSMLRLLAQFQEKYPDALLVRYEPFEGTPVRKALESLGVPNAKLSYRLDAAKVIVALDADLLGTDPLAARYAHQFASGRTPDTTGSMNRLYAIESLYSVTGSAADFRLPVRSSDIGSVLARIEAAVDARLAGDRAAPVESATPFSELSFEDRLERAIQSIAFDLVANEGASLVAVGPHQPAQVHSLALRLNSKLGNLGGAVRLVDTPNVWGQLKSVDLSEFVQRVRDSKIKTAVVLANNPVFGSPRSLSLHNALEGIPFSIYLADYADETAAVCRYVIPAAHPLESWSDCVDVDGIYGVGQPLIEPLLGGRSALELLASLGGIPFEGSENYVRQTAKLLSGDNLSDRQWRELLHSGYLTRNLLPSISNKDLKLDEVASIDPTAVKQEIVQGNLELVIYPSDTLFDGRLANNAWLQELPQPVTKLTWDNAAIVSPKTAATLGLKQGNKATVKIDGFAIDLPVFVVPGQAEGSIAVQRGYGRVLAGSVGTGVGHDVAGWLKPGKEPIFGAVSVSPTAIPYRLATTQDHFAIDEGGLEEIARRTPTLVREGTLKHFLEHPDFAPKTYAPHHANESLWKEPIDKIEAEMPFLPQWGMTIDLNKCIGCNACVVACQAENNVPVVGKDQVARGREMHWLRIDRYFQCDMDKTRQGEGFDDPTDVTIVSQPVACVHCETAPCEQVCPVAATVHTEEGINAMAYNRCIGTRYCANNCPYKVRRFNYYNYNTEYGYFYGWQDWREKVNTKLQSLVLNPEVTVRGRGVMEKCTYCIQRVQNGKIQARQQGDGRVQDGSIQTACQEACPTQAIVFGNLADPTTRVAQLFHSPRSYAMLEELNIKPRTQYLARLRNVPEGLMNRMQANPPEIPDHGGHGGHGDHEGHEDHGDHDHATNSRPVSHKS